LVKINSRCRARARAPARGFATLDDAAAAAADDDDDDDDDCVPRARTGGFGKSRG